MIAEHKSSPGRVLYEHDYWFMYCRMGQMKHASGCNNTLPFFHAHHHVSTSVHNIGACLFQRR
jgi:hypothetical protein